MVCMRTNLILPTTSSEPSLNTREFCTARGTTMKNILMKLWKHLNNETLRKVVQTVSKKEPREVTVAMTTLASVVGR